MTLYTDIPTTEEITELWQARSPAGVTIYVPTDPASTGEAERIAFKNLARQALEQLPGEDREARLAREAVVERLDDIHDDALFWRYQARTLAVFATPNGLRSFRLPNRLSEFASGGTRFFVKPLLRAVTFPQTAFVLTLSINSARLLETVPDAAPEEVHVPGMPGSLADAVGSAAFNDRPAPRRLTEQEGRDVRIRQYARAVNHALRSFLRGRGAPLVLAAAEPMNSAFRAECSYHSLVPETVPGNPEDVGQVELVESARTVLDSWYGAQLAALHERFEERTASGRTSTDLSEIARLVTHGVVETLFVDIDAVVPGTLDGTGSVAFAPEEEAAAYGVVDEIARRAWDTGARLLAVRREEVPGQGDAAAILRYSPT